MDLTCIDSKLDDVLKDLNLLEKQGNIAKVLTNAENADKLSGMVEDIRDAMMEYQVCLWSASYLTLPNIHSRRPYNKTSLTKPVGLL